MGAGEITENKTNVVPAYMGNCKEFHLAFMPLLGFPGRPQSGLLSGVETLTWLLAVWAVMGTVLAAGQLGGDGAPFTARTCQESLPCQFTLGTDWSQSTQAPSSLGAFAHAVPSACKCLCGWPTRPLSGDSSFSSSGKLPQMKSKLPLSHPPTYLPTFLL